MNKLEKPGGYGYGHGVLSNSLISDALHCGYKFHVTYERQTRSDVEASYFSVGRIVHDAIESFHNEGPEGVDTTAQLVWLRNQMVSNWRDAFGEVVTSEIVIYHEALDKAVQETLEYGRSIGKQWVAPTRTAYWKQKHGLRFKLWDENQLRPLMRQSRRVRFTDTLPNLFQQTTKCLENFVALHSSRPRPDQLLSEHEITPLELKGGVKKSGKIDRVEITLDDAGVAEEIKIFDYKTGAKKRWEEVDVRNSSQLLWYAYAMWEWYGVLPNEVGIWDLYNGVITTATITEADINRFLKRLEVNLDFLAMRERWKEETGQAVLGPIPAGTGGFGCPCDLAFTRNEEVRCPYYKTEEESDE